MTDPIGTSALMQVPAVAHTISQMTAPANCFTMAQTAGAMHINKDINQDFGEYTFDKR